MPGHIASDGLEYSLQVPTVLLVVERNTPCTSILLVAQKGTSTTCTCIQLLLEMDTPCTSILLVVKTERNTPCKFKLLISGKDYTLHVHKRLLLVLFLQYEVEKSYINEGIQEKISPASALLPVVKCLSPASGSVRCPWSRISPVLPSYANFVSIG